MNENDDNRLGLLSQAIDLSVDQAGENHASDTSSVPLSREVANALIEVERDYLAAKLGEYGDLTAKLGEYGDLAERLATIEAMSVEFGARLDAVNLDKRRYLEAEHSAILARSLATRVTGPTTLPAKLSGVKWLIAQFCQKKRNKLRRERREYALLSRSILFSTDWYLQTYPEVAAGNWDPLLHYIRYGWRERRQPGPWFDAEYYRQCYPDVAAMDVNPLWHYLVFGAIEGRTEWAMPISDPALLRSRSPATFVRATEAAERQRVLIGEGSSAANAERPILDNPTLWYYVGDTLEWFKAHDRVTGVGRVSTELLFSSLTSVAQLARPCIIDPSETRLISISTSELDRRVGDKLGRCFPNRPFSAKNRHPSPGDHIFFTGLVWTERFVHLFRQLDRSGIGFSVLVYDIIPLEQQKFTTKEQTDSFAVWLATTLQTADRVFVASAIVKDKILRWAALSGVQPRAKIVPITFGLSDLRSPADLPEVVAWPRLSAVRSNNFVLSVGTIDRRKNQVMLCRIWHRLKRAGLGKKLPQLVLVGRDDVGIGGDRSVFADLIESGDLLVLQGMSDAEMAALTRSCRFTAFASTSEGYGLPVAESIQFGKLCLTSNLPVVREHAGDLAWYFSTNDFDAAESIFRKAIEDDVALRAAEAKIAANFARPTWEDAYSVMAGEALDAARRQPTKIKPAVSKLPFPGAKEHDPAVVLETAAKWCTDQSPEVSILVINWNAADLTLECIRQVWANTSGHTYEIVIVDNGSTEADLCKLAALGRGVRLVPLGINRFFGEANNIAAEAAVGQWLVLLNNDAFPQAGWIKALMRVAKDYPAVGAVGPMLLYPDGTVQEAGACVDADGFPTRFGHGAQSPTPDLLVEKYVDYISAAALLLPREAFLEVGGFDLSYEPAYYEDVDLCLKLWAIGRPVVYCPDCEVVHIEGSSANGDRGAERRRRALGDLNRAKLMSRWGTYLRERKKDALEGVRSQFIPAKWSRVSDADPKPTAAIYTPYALTPGGGERYLLSIASILADTHKVILVSPYSYSDVRLRNLACGLDLDLSGLRTQTEAEFLGGPMADLLMTMGNSVLPRVAGHAATAIYQCQFPFVYSECSSPDPTLLDGYKAVTVYSEYARNHYLSALKKHGLASKPVNVVYPPVPQVCGCSDKGNGRIIMSVGRFFVGGHSKRQDLLIKAFKQLVDSGVSDTVLHLVGSSTPRPEDMDYLASLYVAAKGLPVQFHVNCSHEDLHALYRQAGVCWHATGLGANLDEHPDKAEHFGISIVEAMSAGAIPLAFDAGGPREIITVGRNGFRFSDIDDLVKQTRLLLTNAGPDEIEKLRTEARKRAQDFAFENFRQSVLSALFIEGEGAR